MKLGLDIDHTITGHPELFRFMAKAWVANGGEVHFVTARPASQRMHTTYQLIELGFGNILLDGEINLHMYPHDYKFPWPSQDYEDTIRGLHSEWKAHMCRSLGIDVLYDDCARNVNMCRRTGTTAFHVTRAVTM